MNYSNLNKYIEQHYIASQQDYAEFDHGMIAEAECLESSLDLEKVIEEIELSFSSYLLELIDERQVSDVTVYKKAQIDRRLFSKIRSSKAYTPSKKTCLALAIALELDYDQAQALLEKAGFTLSRSSKTDVIIEYFIVNREYNLMTINDALDHHGLDTL